MTRAVLGLGSNLGARRALLGCAQALLAAQPGLRVLAASPLYHTPPLGPPQPDYLNAALLIDSAGRVRELTYRDAEGNRSTFRFAGAKPLAAGGHFDPPQGVEWEKDAAAGRG